MAKINSKTLRDKAQKLLEEAQKIEDIECAKIGKITLDFYKKNKLTDENLKQAIEKIYSEKS